MEDLERHSTTERITDDDDDALFEMSSLNRVIPVIYVALEAPLHIKK